MLVEQTPEMPAGEAMQAMVMANLRQEVGHLAEYIEITVTPAGPTESWAERDALRKVPRRPPGVERVIDHTHLRGYRFTW
jgi:hypothetical protein